MSTLDRRHFLLGTGGVLLGSLGACKLGSGRVLHTIKGGPLTGIVDTVASVCMQCPAACGIQVKRVDGVPTQIRGNPVYPTNLGGLCPKGLSGLQVLYDPDRIKGPMRRTGPRGSGKWTQISWKEALAEVAERLQKLRRSEALPGAPALGPESLVFQGGRYQGSMEPLVKQLLRAYGSPNDLGNGSVGSDGTKVAVEMTQGIHDYPGFDWEQTNYVISFGASWIEAYRPTAYLLRAYGHLRRGRPGMRAKFVHVDTRFSVTGAKADEWVSIRPGTDAALALGIAHVLVRDELYDKAFVAEHTFGFEDWKDEAGAHKGFKQLVLEDYAPAQVAEITGVEAARVERLAHEFASRRPAFAVGERGTSMQTNGLYTRTAIHALNALIGSINKPGGVLIQQAPPLRPLPEPQLDAVAQAGLSTPRIDGAGSRRYPLATEVSQALPDALLDPEQPRQVGMLFLYYTNPIFSRTNRTDFEAIFRDPEKVRFLVSFSPFWDESTQVADLVLPDHTYLERWQDVPVLPSVGYPVLGLRQPVMKAPLYDTRSTGDVLLQLGHALGGTVAASLPWKSFRELIEWRLAPLAGREGGSVSGSSPAAVAAEVEAAGGWWDDRERFLPWEEVFRTPSGRYEFFSQTMRAGLAKVLRPGESPDALLAELGVEARGDDAYLPHYEPVRYAGEPEAYPLHLNTYKPMTRAEGRGANQPYLQELGGLLVHERWSTWLEINPETARKLGIADGQQVVVEAPPDPRTGAARRIEIKARHFVGARPDVVNIPFENGHRGYGHWARRLGVNPNDLLVRDEDRLCGQAAYFGTRVRVRRV